MNDTRIEQLRLTNFRCFESLTVDFHPELTVLVAENGGGKTTVLEAVARVLARTWSIAGLGGIHLGGAGPFDQELTRLVRDESGAMCKAGSLDVQANLTVHGLTWNNWINSPSPAGFDQLGTLLQAGHVLPVLARYGTERAYHDATTRREDLQGFSLRTGAYDDALSGVARFDAFSLWFEALNFEAYNEQARGVPSVHQPRQRLAALNRAVEAVLRPSGWHSLFWDAIERKVMVNHPEQPTLPLSSLSDGVRGLIALTADLAHRCLRLNPGLRERAALETPGVVLIDEVDLHLHPSWQQVVLAGLREAFPRLQFIVTTHSPQVLSTVPAECIRFIDGDHCWSPEHETQGLSSADLLASMGVHSTPDIEPAQNLTAYRALLQQGLADRDPGPALYAALVEHFGEHHPELENLRLFAKVQALKLRRAKEG